ncbi:DEAD/DEAH box helicase family protein [Clostridium tagluense]|uniref:DEAD/DEAH box helicase family protein n=1 Tax=Clostridium tagluense TaxID=360422 RepID=UPI001C0CF704|nr:DEAD/DEAH box helicase family protein [Clostridium tagluense]MBU3129014.1 DEAD/DEAH box helicase family protein [Clostridium tagluense]
MFRNLNIKRCYRSRYDELDRDFVVPLLANAKTYDRGTGYFSVSVLANLVTGLIPYIKNGGDIRIVTSVELMPEDREVLQKGLEIGREKVLKTIEYEIEKEIEDEESTLKLDVITNLIAAGRLVVHIAYMPTGGIYHEKIGIMTDFNDDSVCFIGSANETYSAYKRNFESLMVLKSWEGDKGDIDDQKNYFEKLWNNEIDGLEVFSFTDALSKKLFTRYKISVELSEAIRKLEELYFTDKVIVQKKTLYPYQEVAIKQFTGNNYSHFYEMATGTGKTFTAVKTIEKLQEKFNNLFVIILVHQIDLQEQWEKALMDNNYSSYLFGGIAKSKDWEERYDECVIDYFSNESMVISICIYDTFFSKLYKEVDSFSGNKMLIVDEAHELSANQIRKLPETFKFRLGLSATPERHNINETEEIISFFTRSRIDTYKYSIDEAIENGFLSKYEYYPIFVKLSSREFELYQNYTKKLIYLFNQKERDYSQITEVSNNRSIIVKKANAKLEKLLELIEKKYNFNNAVLYCGQGKDYETEKSIIDIATKYLAVNGGYRVSQFTSKTDYRTRVLREFENGYYDTLVAIKCFDQGVDVPKLDKIYIMASDSLSRQTIQRRGRVLRQCKETGKNIAFIYDMVVLPPEGIFDGIGVNSLVSNELRRVREYMRLSENLADSDLIVQEIQELYNIQEEEIDAEFGEEE